MFRDSPGDMMWGAVFTALLLIACATDIRTRRIPNPLVIVIGAGGFVHSIATRPLGPAIWHSAGGLTLGLAIWILFWVGGMLGAGDVKLFASAGAWLGPPATWRAALVAALVGGVLALAVVIRRRQLGMATQRLALVLSSRSLAVLRPTESADLAHRRQHLPYGVALAAGAIAAAWIPGLFS